MGDAPDEVPLKNETPEIITSGLSTVIGVVQTYGWFLLLGVVLVIYYKDKLQSALDKITKQSENRNDYKKYDTDEAQQRLESMERARQRLQEKFNEEAAKYAEEQRKREEEKRLAKIEEWNRHQEGKGYRSKVKPEEPSPSTSSSSTTSKPKPKDKLRPSDYNPLMGGGGSNFCYRPTRRGGGGG